MVVGDAPKPQPWTASSRQGYSGSSRTATFVVVVALPRPPPPHDQSTLVSAHDAQRTHGGAERCGFCGDRRRECFTEKDARQRTGRSVWAVGAGRVGQGRGGPWGEGEHADLQAWVLQLKLILAFWRAPECKLGSLNTKIASGNSFAGAG